MFTTEQIKQLEAPLARERVAQRSQAGRQLSYIEGWWAIAEANRIFGFDGWTSETIETRLVAEHERTVRDGKGWGVSYVAKVAIQVRARTGEDTWETVTREGIGAGHGIDRDLGLAHESAIKEAETDARKRALMTFGNPFGLALYDKTQANVESAPAPASERSGGITPAPEGPDFWGCAGHVGLNANQAKKAGLDGVHEKMREDIRGLHTDAARREWIEANLSDIRKMPQSWRTILRLEMEEQADMRPHAA